MRSTLARRWPLVAAAAILGIGFAVPSGPLLPTLTPPSGPVLPGRPPRPPAAVGGAGAEGIGDSYFPRAGNGGYDVADYDLALTYEPETRRLAGRATITATATADLTSFHLDFTGLTTTAITVNGTPAAAQQRDDGELVVTPATPLSAGGTFTAVVQYGGQPQALAEPGLGASGFLTSADGAVAIGEPQVAATWFPVNDHPRDKATYTIRISAPDRLEALANGVLVGQRPADRPGYTTWTWRVSSPMAPYLATIVVGDYRVAQSTHDGLPVVLAVATSLPSSIDAELARTPELLDWLESVFGPYPFDAVGGIVVGDDRVGYALENQTRPIYGPVFFGIDDSSWVIVHELAPQWYGDSVSVDDWREVWLNEGFATYAEWLWYEHEGTATAQEMFDSAYNQRDGAAIWRVPPGDLGLDHLFRDPGSEYTRGAMTLHALRITVGDEAFFRVLREWAVRYKDGTATTAQFVELAEEVAGRQLDALFHAWLYGTTRPPRP